jgi:Flp pilus assembly protein TadD
MNCHSRLFLPLCAVLGLFLASCGKKSPATQDSASDEFFRLMTTGKNYLDQGQAAKALEVYKKAVQLAPADPDVHLNLANASLLAGNAEDAAREAEETLKVDPSSVAAYFVKGSALIRLGQFEAAVQALQTARNLDTTEPALSFQLGFAHFRLNQWDEAIALLSEVVMVQPEHPSAHFHLSQALLRVEREQEAQQSLEIHQQIAVKNAGTSLGPEKLEKSKYTEARVPFRLAQPAKTGVPVKFVDDTARAFGGAATKYRGPIAVLDPNHTGTNSLFVHELGVGFRLLLNLHAIFQAFNEPYLGIEGASYSKMLAGDMQNNRYEDVIVIGDKGTHIFKFATNGLAMDVAPFSRLAGLQASDGVLVDLDFTGKLDLLAVTPTNDLRLFRQFGPLLFTDITSTSGIPMNLTNIASVAVADWPKDEMMDVIAGRTGNEPMLLAKQRGGLLVPTNINGWPSGTVLASGDLNNDLRDDLVTYANGKIHFFHHGTEEKRELSVSDADVRAIYLFDYDNDGWLDVWAAGDRLTVWRNVGQSGFEDVSKRLGLEGQTGPFSALHFADFDVDGDTDAVAVSANGLKYLRNDGGNANQQLKLRLLGNRSNASGLGVKVEVRSGGLQLVRTVHSLPVEIGVGTNAILEAMIVHWFNLAANSIDVPVDPLIQLPVLELILPEGSCPYMYAWDGRRFRFVTDLLGAAPIGLPVADGVYIEADPEEYAWIGNETNFVPRNGYYTVQITEELREVLYLDEAKLVVVDHPPGTEVHPTDKLLPRKPFPAGALLTLASEHPLRGAETLSGRDVASELRAVDGHRVSPEKLRLPQQRGMAEPHGVILDFGPLDSARPLVLVMNGWLRFGGGMANINSSHDPSIPFPFPTLEAEVSGEWHPVDVTVGAPAGKTKTILVELAGKIPEGARRLKLQTGFEIHWDRIALMEKLQDLARVAHLSASRTDLHWRGFSQFEDLSWDWPLTPAYEIIEPNPKWRITPGGWCTRYGPVDELIARRDEGLLLMNGGDELTLEFAASELPPKPPGFQRQFFIYTDGWDKDADFHVRAGTTVGPLPWHGINDQIYGSEPRPKFPSDALHEKFNTRWVEPRVLQRVARGN